MGRSRNWEKYNDNLIMTKYDSYIFDLDNTLYDEKIYLFSAYKEIADYISSETKINSNIIFNFLIQTFSSEGRANILINYF